jgi:hypothetical protein
MLIYTPDELAEGRAFIELPLTEGVGIHEE